MWPLIISLGIKLLSLGIEKHVKDKEVKKDFIKLIESFEKQPNISTGLYKSCEAQKERILGSLNNAE